jgi:hypothetical protein
VWRLDRWLPDKVWESEDGPSRIDVCGREYYWDNAMTWIDSVRVGVEGRGGDADDIRPGVRIFDTTRVSEGSLWHIRTSTQVNACHFRPVPAASC